MHLISRVEVVNNKSWAIYIVHIMFIKNDKLRVEFNYWNDHSFFIIENDEWFDSGVCNVNSGSLIFVLFQRTSIKGEQQIFDISNFFFKWKNCCNYCKINFRTHLNKGWTVHVGARFMGMVHKKGWDWSSLLTLNFWTTTLPGECNTKKCACIMLSF